MQVINIELTDINAVYSNPQIIFNLTPNALLLIMTYLINKLIAILYSYMAADILYGAV